MFSGHACKLVPLLGKEGLGVVDFCLQKMSNLQTLSTPPLPLLKEGS